MKKKNSKDDIEFVSFSYSNEGLWDILLKKFAESNIDGLAVVLVIAIIAITILGLCGVTNHAVLSISILIIVYTAFNFFKWMAEEEKK